MHVYKKSIMQACKNCGRKAHMELFNTYNAPLGFYCIECGNAEIIRYAEIDEDKQK